MSVCTREPVCMHMSVCMQGDPACGLTRVSALAPPGRAVGSASGSDQLLEGAAGTPGQRWMVWWGIGPISHCSLLRHTEGSTAFPFSTGLGHFSPPGQMPPRSTGAGCPHTFGPICSCGAPSCPWLAGPDSRCLGSVLQT